MRLTAALAMLSLAAGLALPAAAAPMKVDTVHSFLMFQVSHLGYSNMFGRFADFEATLELDEAEPEAASLEVVVRTASVDTFHDRRNEHLRSPDFFNVEEFPEMTFRSTEVERTGERTALVTGDFTLLGVTRPVTLELTFNRSGPNPLNGTPTVGFSGHGTLSRSDFGMTYGLPGVGDEVTILIEAEAVPR